MRLNNKGMSLIELIVSFAIVTVAVVYFSQTITTVSNVYKKSQEQTDKYVDKNYTLRIMDAYIDYFFSKSPNYFQDTAFPLTPTISMRCDPNGYPNECSSISTFLDVHVNDTGGTLSNNYSYKMLNSIFPEVECVTYWHDSTVCAKLYKSEYYPKYKILRIKFGNQILYKYIELNYEHDPLNTIGNNPKNNALSPSYWYYYIK